MRVRALPPVEFRYTRARRVDYVRTFVENVPYMARLGELVRRTSRALEASRADLVISDFEPVLARAAREARIPLVSLDHQQFLVHCDLSALPLALRAYAAFMAPFVRGFCSGQRESIVSSFFEADLAPGARAVTQVGVLLRREVRDARPSRGAHLVAYLRRDSASRALDALARCGAPVRVYGLGAQRSQGRLSFLPVHPTRFVDDLATARGLVTTAGNQLVGEALWLTKPVLAIPEPGNHEQRINAWFLERTGAGRRIEIEQLDASWVRRFLDDEGELAASIAPHRRDGTALAVARIEHHLEHAVEEPCGERSRSFATSLVAALASPSDHAS
ncbi:Hypothetical protein I5071_64150 [Sandaracinus amylolyticus]|nr:Hypothetical protein I5071_64150 [Sandaracinus amylolyticus]